MKLDMTFEESNQRIDLNFGEIQTASDDGFERGYAEGYTAGEKDGFFEGQMESAALFGIQNEVTGTNLVTLDYVNENEHNVEVQLSSDTITDFSGVEVKQTGKNILDENELKPWGNGSGYSYYRNNEMLFKGGQTYTFKLYGCEVPNGIYVYVNGVEKASSYSKESLTFTFNEDTYGYIRVYWTVANVPPIEDFYAQLELGSVATDYEPYQGKTYLANADGTLNVKSISPIMNIICEGVDISAKYYQCPSGEYDRFWDNYQDNGNRTDYRYAFAGNGWNDETVKPKYNITPNNATYLFYMCKCTDLKKTFEEQGIILDLLNCTSLQNTFYSTSTKTLPPIDVRNILSLYATFGFSMSLEELELLNINKDCASFVSCFDYCYNLVTLKITGTISINISFTNSSKLSDESVQNIIDCLADLTGQTSQTVTFHSNIKINLTDEQLVQITSKNWKLG